MPRTLGAANIKAWRMEQLINDLAVGTEPYAVLADRYGIEEQTVKVFVMNHKADIEAKKADWAAEFDHIWSTRKENRLRLLTLRLEEVEGQIALLHEHAERETDTIRTVDPDASTVPINSREYLPYVKEQRALLREIADQTGQLPQRVAVDLAAGKSGITSFDTIAMDANGNLLGVNQVATYSIAVDD